MGSPIIRTNTGTIFLDDPTPIDITSRGPVGIKYSDLNQKTPGINPLVIDTEAVFQALRNLFNTLPGERLFRPEIYTNLRSIIFAPIDQITANQLKQFLITAVELWEPRVGVDRRSTRITAVPLEEGYDIVVVYRVAGIQDQTFQYSSFFEILR